MSKVPAVLVCDARTGNLNIAGLTILDRMVVTTHRAGCAPIFVVAETTPPLPRSHALGIAPTIVREAPPDSPAVLMTGALLLDVRDVERVIEARGQLVTAEGAPLPIRFRGGAAQPVIASATAHAVNDIDSAQEAERKLWASLSSSADGLVDRFFNRPLGRVLSKTLVHTPVSPNQISIASIAIGIASAPLFAAGQFVGGALLFQLCAVIDCVDGDLARALFKQSPLGKWLDIGGDQVVHVCVFLGVGLGVARYDPATPALALGVSAALGVLVSFPVIIRGLRQPVEQRGYLLARLMDATANRDFTVLLLVLAIVGRVDLFIWMAGFGIHLFWIALLVLQGAARSGSRGHPQNPT